MEFLIVLVVLVVVVLIVSAPLRRPRAGRDPGAGGSHERDGATEPHSASKQSAIAELLAAREAKYREIRDAELDHRTGKLSDEDYEALERTLRAEAVEILRALDKAAPPPKDPVPSR